VGRSNDELLVEIWRLLVNNHGTLPFEWAVEHAADGHLDALVRRAWDASASPWMLGELAARLRPRAVAEVLYTHLRIWSDPGYPSVTRRLDAQWTAYRQGAPIRSTRWPLSEDLLRYGFEYWEMFLIDHDPDFAGSSAEDFARYTDKRLLVEQLRACAPAPTFDQLATWYQRV